MTVSAQTPINRSTGNGVTTVFPYTFKIISDADIEVRVDDVVKTLTVDYTVSGAGADAGGNVTMLVAPASSTSVLRKRNMALVRTTDYQDQGELPAPTLDADIDATVLMMQQVNANTERAMLLPDGLAGFSSELPTPVANYYLRVNSAGTAYEQAALATAGALTVTPFIETLLDDSSAANARTTLGATTVGGQVFTAANAAEARTALAAVGTSDVIAVAQGGTGGVTANAARANLLQLPPVRQTVLNGPVDTNGFSAFGGSTGSATVTSTGTLTATAANGVSGDRIGAIVNPSWTSLSTNGTMYLFLDIAADGTCTTGSTTLLPTYRWGGADVTTNNQFTFNIQEMVGKVGNGSVATQTYRVFVGEVTVAGAVVTAITWYALQGRYDSGFTATLPALNSTTSRNHNLGVAGSRLEVVCECTTTEYGYAVGAQLDLPSGQQTGNYFTNPMETTRLTAALVVSASYYTANRTTWASAVLTAANWKYKFIVKRPW